MSKEMTKVKSVEENGIEFKLEDKSLIDLMTQDAKEYIDLTEVEDLAIPRVRILQSGSKEVKKADPDRIEGAEEGDFLNTLTNEIMKGDAGIYFVPVKRQISYVEWKDLKKGGGLINNFGNDATAYNNAEVDDKGRHLSKAGNEIIRTSDVYGYIVNTKDSSFTEVLISFTKTQTKKMKKWNTLIRTLLDTTGKQLPEYAGCYKLTTVPESNDQGSWFNYEVKFAGYTLGIPTIGKMLYNKAKDFAKLIKENNVSAIHDEIIEEPSSVKSNKTELI
jgi:hypothetical protein